MCVPALTLNSSANVDRVQIPAELVLMPDTTPAPTFPYKRTHTCSRLTSKHFRAVNLHPFYHLLTVSVHCHRLERHLLSFDHFYMPPRDVYRPSSVLVKGRFCCHAVSFKAVWRRWVLEECIVSWRFVRGSSMDCLQCHICCNSRSVYLVLSYSIVTCFHSLSSMIIFILFKRLFTMSFCIMHVLCKTLWIAFLLICAVQ